MSTTTSTATAAEHAPRTRRHRLTSAEVDAATQAMIAAARTEAAAKPEPVRFFVIDGDKTPAHGVWESTGWRSLDAKDLPGTLRITVRCGRGVLRALTRAEFESMRDTAGPVGSLGGFPIYRSAR